jgi:acetyltransferase
MTAARAAARNKPVMVVKSGRVAEGAKAAASHTGALAGADAVYDAAFRRAGILRVHDIDELFAAVETLARCRSTRQAARLAIMTNGGGIGVMAVDDLVAEGGRLAELSDKTKAALDEVLPATWSKANPVDIIGDAPGSRYVAALNVLLDAPEVDTVLCMHAPVAISSPTEIASAIVELVRKRRCSLMTCWVGEESVAPGRRIFNEANIPTYDTPGNAVQAFMHTVRYRRTQEILMQTPPSAPTDFAPATAQARDIIDQALAAKQSMLTEPDAKAVLSAYGIPTVETHIAHTPGEAAQRATQMGQRVALKILSPDLSHKSDVGGVMLNLDGPEEVEKAATSMLKRVAELKPQANITGFTVQTMAQRPTAEELIVGVTTDAIFGPVILFGQGGTAVEVVADRAVALPPLNMNLARDLVSRTRVFNLLRGFRDRPPANLDAICLSLMQVSQLIIDFPEIVELDINPLFADAEGVLALDARMKVLPATLPGTQRLAIRPYPKDLEETIRLPDDREVLLRPIRPEDEPEHRRFISKLSNEDKRFRFFNMVRELPHSEMARLTQIDYAREMAFIATAPAQPGQSETPGESETLGVVRAISDPNNEQAEFAVVVRSDLKGLGLGRTLTEKLIRYCRARGTKVMVGQVLTDNVRMLRLAGQLGFERGRAGEPDVVEVKLAL